MASYLRILIYGSTQSVCTVASAINGFIYWTQTSSEAEAIADRY